MPKTKLFSGISFDDFLPDEEKKTPINNYDLFEEYDDLDSKKKKEEIRKLQIGNEKELRNLVEKDMVKAVIARFGEAIQLHFVQMPRRESPNITSLLGVEGKEKILEKFLAEAIEKGLKSCKAEINKAMDDETWN